MLIYFRLTGKLARRHGVGGSIVFGEVVLKDFGFGFAFAFDFRLESF